MRRSHTLIISNATSSPAVVMSDDRRHSSLICKSNSERENHLSLEVMWTNDINVIQRNISRAKMQWQRTFPTCASRGEVLEVLKR